ncbi:MAG TPA: OmpA family protein [Verrucomicrobiae bacterium]|jgi:peptidoglycan-associated lipoprotein
MKNARSIGLFLLTMTLAAGVTGCKHRAQDITTIPGGGGPPSSPPPAINNTPGNPQPGPGVGEITPPPNAVTGGNIPINPSGAYANLFNGPHSEDHEKFKADIIYFDFDSSTIKASEESKLQAVADYFKTAPATEALTVEGNCDERGTEKYNLSLGERRALAAREYLSNLGVSPDRIQTKTWGASQPADKGHNEEAWKQNRRDEFVLITPKN